MMLVCCVRSKPSKVFQTLLSRSHLKTRYVSYQYLEITDKEGIRVLSINRPEKRNCVNKKTAHELFTAFQDFNADESARVGVLCGNSGTFCSGYDLQELADSENPVDSFLKEDFEIGPAPMGPSRLVLQKPVIAAVSGYAVAGGLELALMCDLRVVEEDAVFGVLSRRFGVPLIDGGTVRLPALIGLSRALDMILTGRRVGAQEALQIGLANKVVAKGQSLNQAIELAQQIAAFPQKCMLADRRSAYNAVYSPTSLQNALNFEHHNGIPVVATESQLGAHMFINKKY